MSAPRGAGIGRVALAIGVGGVFGRWALAAVDRAATAPRDREAVTGAPVRGAAPPIAAATAVSLALAAWGLYALRPLYHGIVMLAYVYPLATWMPLALGPPVVAASALVGLLRGDVVRGLSVGLKVRTAVVLLAWLAGLTLTGELQAEALYHATRYRPTDSLPATTEPRLLPKHAAESYGSAAGLRGAHLVVDPSTNGLVWSAEHEPGRIPRGPSDAVLTQPLDRVDGTLRRVATGFDPAVTRWGPGSPDWRAYERHYFTSVDSWVVVPLGGGRAVAVASYVGYRGFPVRRPYWKGVYVYHQDGTLEDLTPAQALHRPELVRSGRLFPEHPARQIAEAYRYRNADGDAVEVTDPPGNPQPYLTNAFDRQIRWVTVAHPPDDDRTISTIFLTDSTTGATQVWRAPPRDHLLSNDGAADLARALRLQWRGCCDSDDNSYELRRVTEARPVFARGQLYYLVAIVPTEWLDTPQPVEKTVLVDARRRRIVRVFDHANSEADDALRAFFRGH